MAAQQSAVAQGRTARADMRFVGVLALLALVAFGVAFAVAHTASGRTVREPARVVTVAGPAKVAGTVATSPRLGAPSDLAKLVPSGAIAGLAAPPPAKKKTVAQTTATTPSSTSTSTHSSYTPRTPRTPSTPKTSTAPKITVG